MVYKFNDYEHSTSLEIELFNEENQSKELEDSVSFSISDIDDTDACIHIHITKKQLFKLIRALHCIQKEMA